MSYHREHIALFLKNSAIPPEQTEVIMARAQAAVGIDDEDGSIFSADNLARILGDPELVDEFNSMWNMGQLQLQLRS